MATILIVLVVLALFGLPAGILLLFAKNLADEFDRQQQFQDEMLTEGTERFEGNKRSRTKDINPY